VFDLEIARNPSCGHLRLSEILNAVTNISFAEKHTEHQLGGGDVAILASNEIVVMQHFGTKQLCRQDGLNEANQEALVLLSRGNFHYLHPAGRRCFHKHHENFLGVFLTASW
jgi:hypothetical protein